MVEVGVTYTIKHTTYGWVIVNATGEQHRMGYKSLGHAVTSLARMNRGLIKFETIQGATS